MFESPINSIAFDGDRRNKQGNWNTWKNQIIQKQFLDVFLKIMSEWTGKRKQKNRKKTQLFKKAFN